jgi:hypothetical protein
MAPPPKTQKETAAQKKARETREAKKAETEAKKASQPSTSPATPPPSQFRNNFGVDDESALSNPVKKTLGYVDHAITASLVPLQTKLNRLEIANKKLSNRVQQHESSITSLELIDNERSIMIRNVPMICDRESPVDTAHALAPLWRCMHLHTNGVTPAKSQKINIYSVARLGVQRKGNQYVPQIRVRFATPQDKTLFNNNVRKMKDDPQVGLWSCSSEMPSVLKDGVFKAQCTAYQIRKNTPKMKTNIKFRRGSPVVICKVGGTDTWTEATKECMDLAFKQFQDNEIKEAQERKAEEQEQARLLAEGGAAPEGEPSQGGASGGKQGQKRENSNNEPLGGENEGNLGGNSDDTKV